MRWLARLVAAACLCVVGLAGLRCASTDFETELARRRMLALSPAEAAAITAYCRAPHGDGALLVSQFPPLPAPPTTVVAHAGTLAFQYWNNSHYVEDDPHPGFELLCAAAAPPDAIALAPGLWYRDTPMHGE
ncbi:MAG TPA: hypothetical protein VGM88_32645 [Kofleriaceae bacterium]|jgi:hypothetical protein